MSFLSLVGIEAGKIRRSKILLILAAAAVILWFLQKIIFSFRALWEWLGLCFLQVW